MDPRKPLVEAALEKLKRMNERVEKEVPCSKNPKAPHGFNRNASHSLGRYVCDCEGWDPSYYEEPVQNEV